MRLTQHPAQRDSVGQWKILLTDEHGNITASIPTSDYSLMGHQPAQQHANERADIIVRAVNSHDDLMAALTELTARVEPMNNAQHAGLEIGPEDWSDIYALTTAARAALNNAKGESS